MASNLRTTTHLMEKWSRQMLCVVIIVFLMKSLIVTYLISLIGGFRLEDRARQSKIEVLPGRTVEPLILRQVSEASAQF